mmetsp:Transcript_23389/g.66666  ORF Transcript_23389/g.66666 Transcript_23389/m.66666 type:complete len:1073 (-) Transcript_23389:111-3329(-)
MWSRAPGTERRDPDGHQTRVGYILRRCGFERHCGIVTRICVVRGGRRGEAVNLLTASRDGTLKYWDLPANETHGGASSSTSPPPAHLRYSLEEHTAWVNDAVVLPPASAGASAARDSRRVVSASNDNLMKVWQVDEERQGAGVLGALLSLRYHVDYVTCLAYAPHRALLASAGLDARAVVSDLEAATRVLTLPTGENDSYAAASQRSSGAASHRGGTSSAQPSAAQRCAVGQFSGSGQYVPQLLASPTAHSSRDGANYDHGRGSYSEDNGSNSSAGGASVWSLASTRNASLLVCGTASCVVRGWDPRSGVRLWRLRGHTENVRALVLSDDGTICISGSADRTVRVWDVGMRRCIHVFEAHHDSVWALAAAGSSCGYSMGAESGGAGGALSEVFSGGRDGMLLSHDLRLMQTGLVVREPSPLQAIAVPSDGIEIWASAADSHVRRHVKPSSLAPPPPAPAPQAAASSLPTPAGDDSIVFTGTPRLIDYKVLDGKRQVLVKDACNQLCLWDVTNGQCVDFPVPPATTTTEGKPEEDVLKRALLQVNRPVSVPSWFSCDLSLGSLSVYLDVSQCFKAEPDEGDVVIPSANGAAARGAAGRSGEATASAAPANLGTKTLRALFENWVRLPNSPGHSNAADRGAARTGSSRRPLSARSRVFAAPPPLQQDSSTGAMPWDDDQPPGTPSGQGGLTEPPTGGSSSSSFPPATALILIGRNGATTGYRGRLYCGFFNGSESPELLPPWVVDVVWNQRPPPEELCGERTLMFTLARCPSELALPLLPNPYCVATPRTRVRRLMGYLVRVLDFDWSTPAKNNARRPSSAVSLVTRLGRCCVAPGSRGRAASGDSWGSQSDGGDVSSVTRGNAPKRNRSSSRERPVNTYHGGSATVSSGTRRSFGLRRSEDESNGMGNTVVGRVRVDGSPAPLPSVPAQAAEARRRGSNGVGVEAGGSTPPDESYVEILCNDCLVDPEMSLATVRDFIWKKPSVELVLCYRRAARAVMPASPPPPPPLLPGGNGVGKEQFSAGSNNGGVSDDRVSEDVTSELKLNGVDGAWAHGQGTDAPHEDMRDPGVAPKE